MLGGHQVYSKAGVRVGDHLSTSYRVGLPWTGFTPYKEIGEAHRVSGKALEVRFFSNFQHLTVI